MHRDALATSRAQLVPKDVVSPGKRYSNLEGATSTQRYNETKKQGILLFTWVRGAELAVCKKSRLVFLDNCSISKIRPLLLRVRHLVQTRWKFTISLPVVSPALLISVGSTNWLRSKTFTTLHLISPITSCSAMVSKRPASG